tara:strand:+ start:600 stop:869 length:270 start_codon:yes stop_codon:yes gene_type:complete
MSKVFTKQISNTSFALGTEDGIKYMSVKNSSASAQSITITGSLVVNGVASAAITLAQGDIVTMASDTPLEGVTITSGGASALADLIATQ